MSRKKLIELFVGGAVINGVAELPNVSTNTTDGCVKFNFWSRFVLFLCVKVSGNEWEKVFLSFNIVITRYLWGILFKLCM